MPHTILIAEDDQDITNLVKLYLESSGYRVLCAPDGAGYHDAPHERLRAHPRTAGYQ